MIRLLLLSLAAWTAQAALIRGSVVENGTGKPLTRAVVVLEPLPGTLGGVRTERTGWLGAFSFNELPPGQYLVRVSRRGFLPAEFGQKRWNSAGQPVTVDESNPAFLNIRLMRLSAIAGTLVDENDIGLPGHEVAAYRATQPPAFIRSVAADDRGNYRIGGLEPGKYFVRTIARQYEDGAYLPTFSRETVRAEQAMVHETYVEQQLNHVDIRPLPGRLFNLSVSMAPDPDYPEVTLTLASAMGRVKVNGIGHTFTGLPPGDYEVYAEATGGAAYDRINLTGDRAVVLKWTPHSSLTVTPSNNGMVRVRRRDLAGPGPESVIPIADAIVPAGRWEFLMLPSGGLYASSTFPYTMGRSDGWVEFTGRPRSSFGFRLSPGAGSIRGTVKDTAYAPVYLEAYDPVLRKRVGDLKAVRTDAHGQFRFTDLAPGTYRLLATFEYLMPSTEILDSALPLTLTVDRNSDLQKEIDLWVIR